MKKSHLALLTVLAILTTFSGQSRAATIGIDFGCDTPSEPGRCVEGDDPLQNGYVGWVGSHVGNPGIDYNETRSFNSDFAINGSFDLNITSNGLFFRDYGFTPSSDSPFVNQTNLLADNINLNQPGSIVFSFSGLASGGYTMQSYHHDSWFGISMVPFDITVVDALGTRTVASGLDTSGGYDPSAITTALFSFTVGVNGYAKIAYDTSSAGLTEHMAINGFQLTGTAVPILPAFWLFVCGLLGLVGVARSKL